MVIYDALNTSKASDAAFPSGTPRLFVCRANDIDLRIQVNSMIYILVKLVIYDVNLFVY